MFTTIASWLSGVSTYVMAGLGAFSLVLSGGLYVEHLRLKAVSSDYTVAKADLKTSGQSITGLETSLGQINSQLTAEQTAEQKQKDDTAAALRVVAEKDKGLVSLQAELQARKSLSNCPVPKDLNDAWNVL